SHSDGLRQQVWRIRVGVGRDLVDVGHVRLLGSGSTRVRLPTASCRAGDGEILPVDESSRPMVVLPRTARCGDTPRSVQPENSTLAGTDEDPAGHGDRAGACGCRKLDSRDHRSTYRWWPTDLALARVRDLQRRDRLVARVTAACHN